MKDFVDGLVISDITGDKALETLPGTRIRLLPLWETSVLLTASLDMLKCCLF